MTWRVAPYALAVPVKDKPVCTGSPFAVCADGGDDLEVRGHQPFFGLLSSPGLEQMEDRAFLLCLRSLTCSVLVLGQVIER